MDFLRKAGGILWIQKSTAEKAGVEIAKICVEFLQKGVLGHSLTNQQATF